MKPASPLCLGFLFLLVSLPLAAADGGVLRVPKTVQAGQAFSISTASADKGVLYIVGMGYVARHNVQPGASVTIAAGEVHNAGHYLAILATGSSTDEAEFEVLAASQPEAMSFLAKPSRLPVGIKSGVSGVAYVFDAFHNLILAPLPVAFRLSSGAGSQSDTATTRHGVAWVKLNSAAQAGATKFEASVGGVTETRVVQQVAGDPCNLRMSARPSGGNVLLETEPVRDCRGNPLPDGTIVTFSETRKGTPAATVDVPLKRDIARTEIPAYEGGVISVATGVVMGNEIRVGEKR